MPQNLFLALSSARSLTCAQSACGCSVVVNGGRSLPPYTSTASKNDVRRQERWRRSLMSRNFSVFSVVAILSVCPTALGEVKPIQFKNGELALARKTPEQVRTQLATLT